CARGRGYSYGYGHYFDSW
nr:immunoglobulin heavy chain junction region [Macaca mulatta]MOV38581.1 immunoglobulin heavy chain junction region [Macaca mulatta]MOV39122.1 immunoglobulin heavy chain junction region [Macaca mulatta]MOV39323.1 immunoglobulin heavy chain junction region [Macaca mulatta]MOV39399.1 immunoglobulin heavy chain junction region [Macaca mulatta]